MPREPLHVRVQPAYKRAVQQRARDMQRSEGYVVEEALWAVLRDVIGHDSPPGKRMPDEKPGEEQSP